MCSVSKAFRLRQVSKIYEVDKVRKMGIESLKNFRPSNISKKKKTNMLV